MKYDDDIDDGLTRVRQQLPLVVQGQIHHFCFKASF